MNAQELATHAINAQQACTAFVHSSKVCRISRQYSTIRFFMIIHLNTRQCTNVEEVVVDHGASFEILSRYKLLENNGLQRFKCRQANVKRSK
jgi:hypothetical protein